MKCPKCQHDNPDDAVFCNKCGSKLEVVCSACGKTNPPGSSFCNKCGQRMTEASQAHSRDLSFDEKIAKIQRYLPEGLTEKILSQRDRIEGERKQVTVMFCDLEGFTALTERLGPEEAYSIMDQVYEILIHKVHDYEGTVNEMTGDGIVALFGAPIALEDAPQRAIRSAVAIHREMTKLSDTVTREMVGIPALKMRVGIHSGPVVVGTLGNDLRVEFKAVGDTVNLASRMEALAQPGTTYVTKDTFKLTEGVFRFEALGKKEVKGKEEPVKVYQVIAPSTRRTRFDVSAERGLTPFVGRERELELLLDGFERAKTGRGQAFSIVAEAGIGKSRLLYEFRKGLVNEDVTFLEGKCLSYSKGVAYHPVIDILKGNFDIQEGDGDSEIKRKVREGLKILGADEASTLPYLLELLSVGESGIDEISMSPEGRRDRIIEALKRITLLGSQIRPVIMAVEDLYWVDKSSEDVFKNLLDSIPAARILLIFTYRPQFLHTWGAKSFHSQVTLNRLSNRESLAMVTHLLGTENIEDDLQEMILEKTEGIPFFIEEFVRSLKDLKIIEKEDDTYHLARDIQKVTIPSKIQDVIMARVDSLPVAAKELLQTASVIEREFSYPLIQRVTGLPEQELLKHLSTLKDSEILFERGIYPETDYIFKHAVTREVVYDSILTSRRKQLHEEIAKSIEHLYAKNIDTHYGVLSEHFTAGENYEAGAEYSRRTARKFEKAASLDDAIAYAKKRIACLERLPRTDEVLRKLIDARTVLGLYYGQTNNHVEAKGSVESIVQLAQKLHYRKRVAQIYTILGNYSSQVEEDFPEAFIQLEEAVKICEEENDLLSSVLANLWLAITLSHDCQFEKAEYYFRRALDINQAGNALWGISVMQSNISFFVHSLQGRFTLGYPLTNEAIRIAEESGDAYSKAVAYTIHGVFCSAKGSVDEAIEYILRGVDFYKRINVVSYHATAQFSLGEIFFETGEYQKSIDHYSSAVGLMEQNRVNPSAANFGRIGIERSKVKSQGKDANLELLYGYVYESKAKFVSVRMKRYVGEILLNIDNEHLSEAKGWIEEAIEASKTNGMMADLGQAYTIYAELFKRKGDRTRAKENLTKAIDIYKECGADGWEEKARRKLAELAA